MLLSHTAEVFVVCSRHSKPRGKSLHLQVFRISSVFGCCLDMNVEDLGLGSH